MDMDSGNITPIRDPKIGVVDFGVRIPGYTAIVEGREIPGIMVFERGDKITVNLDRRFSIDVPREVSGSICWMIAQALAIGSGYPHIGAESKVRPFAPKVVGGDGNPDISGGGAWPK